MRDGLVERDEIKRRSAMAAQLTRRVSLDQDRALDRLGGKVLVDEKGKMKGMESVRRSFAYKIIVVKSADDLLWKDEQSGDCISDGNLPKRT